MSALAMPAQVISYGGPNVLVSPPEPRDYQFEFDQHLVDMKERQEEAERAAQQELEVEIFEDEEEEDMAKKHKDKYRIVKVYIVDIHPDVALEKAIIYSSNGEKFTNLNDDELFFELPVMDLLAKHNEERIQVIDREASLQAGNNIYLEAARIRDLQMRVLVLAEF
jgi:hypothetical protein